MPARRRSFPASSCASLVLLVVLCAGLGLGPRVAEGYLALQWTRHLVERNAQTPRVADARPVGRWAAQAVDLLAPHPAAWEAARLALDYGRKLQPKDAAAARALLASVREALERAEASWLRRYGLGSLREEVWQAENSLLLDTGGSP